MAPPKKRERDAAAAANGNAGANANGATGIATTGSGYGAGGGTATTTNAAGDSNSNSKLNGHQQEQELFLQAFEKPTQIYRFLRNRHGTSPIFLNRTLSYMKERMSRNNKKRAAFKVNSILDAVTEKTETSANNYLSIIYNGLYDKSAQQGGGEGDPWWQAGEVVCVESTLYKITKSKRKDSTSDFQEVLSHSSNVIYNPHEDIAEFAALSIPMQCMHSLGDQHTIYKLLFRIKIQPKFVLKSSENGDDDGISNKRSKACTKIFGCELIVFEKNIGCIPEGDYEAAMQELSSTSIKAFSPKKRSWETLPDNYIPLSMKFDVFQQFPTLKFRLTWSLSELPLTINAVEMGTYGVFNEQHLVGKASSNSANDENGTGDDGETQINHNNNCIKSTSALACIKTERIQIVYNFLYSNNTRQQTEYTQEVICPWCGLDCLRLYALLKHLKLCHARFNFTYQPAGSGARIDVTINDAYDGSYAGSPYDLAGPSGCSFARTCGPVRRTTVTNLLVCRPRRQKTCLDEFLVLDEDDLSNQRPYITGHNRLYHHTETCLPVHPKELDIDSEGESDPLWLRQKTIQMIDEFSDVNEGEKELMKLWNLHVMKHGYVGDCQLPLACEMFLDVKGHEIIRKNLYRNFILHMCSLFDYGLVAPETVYKVVQKLQGMLSKYPAGQELMSAQREAQLSYWLAVGRHKEDEQKLKSPQKQSVNANAISGIATLDASSGSSGATVGGGTANSVVDAKSLSAMHPPLKRSATAVKRASMHPQNGLNGNNDKLLGNGGVGAGGTHNKSVAKKTVMQELTDLSGRDRRTTDGGSGKRAGSANSAEREKDEPRRASYDGKMAAVKRKLNTRDGIQGTTASKRHRSDSHGSTTAARGIGGGAQHNNHGTMSSAIAMTTTTKLTTTTIPTPTTTLPKRLVTRRQSVAGNATNNSSTAAEMGSTRSSTLASGNSAKGVTHALRTRHSMPLTKLDRR